MVDPREARFMDRALFLAERGRGRTSPNPVVGAVIVSPEGVVVGQGAHLALGGAHAEVAAIDDAGPRARGATLYCTLEPCTHHGRTGPCVQRIVAAEIGRVVVAARDPNPLVNGSGVAFLRARGIAVDEALREPEAVRQNAPFFTWVRAGRPLVTLKTATSADGFVGRPGTRVRLTGPVSDRHFHRQRAAIDAIAVGSETVIADDPELTPRGAHRPTPLIRVVFDWRLRVPLSARVFSTTAAGPVIMVVSESVAGDRPEQIQRLAAAGATIEPCPSRDLRPVLARLAARGVTWLLVEGGPTLQRAFLAAELVDRVQWVVAPTLLGTGIRHGLDATHSAGAVSALTVTPLGADVLIEWDVHRTDRRHRTDRAQ